MIKCFYSIKYISIQWNIFIRQKYFHSIKIYFHSIMSRGIVRSGRTGPKFAPKDAVLQSRLFHSFVYVIDCEQSLFCSKIRGEKVGEHESRASGEAASSARGGRRAKRETAMVSYNDCEALRQFVSVTTPPIF